MPNLRGATTLDNPEWVTLDFDDGTSSHPIHDPSGQYRAEVSAIVPRIMGGAPPNPMAGALASNAVAPRNPLALDMGGAPASTPAPAPVASDLPASVGAPPLLARDDDGLGDITAIGPAVRPGQTLPSAPRAPGPVVGDPLRSIQGALASQGAPEFAPAPVQSLVRERAPASNEPRAPAPDPYVPRYLQTGGGMGGGTVDSVTRSSSGTTQGLNAKDKAAVDKANAEAVTAMGEANQAEYAARATQFLSDWQRLDERARQGIVEKKALEDQQRDFDTRVETQRRKNEEIAARPIDPSEAFAGDAGAYAFMAAFGDAIANFGAAIAGRGPVADPAGRIGSLIERSVKLQTAQKQADFDAGRISADQLEADREHVRLKLATAAKQQVEIEEQRAHTADEYKALGAFKAKLDQAQKEASAKNAMATARQESSSWQRTVAPGQAAAPGGSGVDYFLGEDQAKNGGWKAVEGYTARQAGGDQIENAVGRFSRATGYNWDPQALGGTGAFRDKDGKVVTADHADVPGVTAVGTNFGLLSGEMGREVHGAIGDLAAGRAKIADPVGAVSDKSIDAQREQMAAGTDEGAFRAMESAARQLRTMRGKVDASVSPGVANAARLRRQEEQGFQASRPGLPPSRPATPEDLRGAGNARPSPQSARPEAPQPSASGLYSYPSTAPGRGGRR